jgi:hypothetical protein
VDGEALGQHRRPEDGALQGDRDLGEELGTGVVELRALLGAAASVTAADTCPAARERKAR